MIITNSHLNVQRKMMKLMISQMILLRKEEGKNGLLCLPKPTDSTIKRKVSNLPFILRVKTLNKKLELDSILALCLGLLMRKILKLLLMP